MSEDIKITRWHHNDCTLGRLYLKDFQCFTLELPFKDNKQGVSAIIPGRYKYSKRQSPSNGHVIELRDVPGRSHIQIHVGNFTRDIKGCILPGKAITFLDDDSIPDVTSSGVTMQKILTLAPDEGIILITDS